MYIVIMKMAWCIPAFVALSFAALGRGQIPPPPAFSGGNAGDWLGSGPIFGFDIPNGPGFDNSPGGGGGGNGGSGGGYSWDWGGDGGGRHQFLDSSNNYGCPGTCDAPSWTGPCRRACVCSFLYDVGVPVNPGRYVDAECVRTRIGIVDGSCRQAGDNCSGIVVRLCEPC
jgi:hypothetical protein